MARNIKLGVATFGALVALCTGQVAHAQVDWSQVMMCVGPGEPGSWDDGHHLVGDVVFDGSTYHIYLVAGQGFNPGNVPFSVGHWTWDGVSLECDEDPANPVLEPEPGQWDAFSILSIAVAYHGGSFHMWYGAQGIQDDPVYVGYATDADGWGDWDKYAGNPLPGLEPGPPGSWYQWGVTPATALMDGGTYSMWLSGSADQGMWRIGYATSTDGVSWIMYPNPVLEGTAPWEGDRVYFPEVVPNPDGSGFAMWYAGWPAGDRPKMGYAVSSDGISWGKWPGNPVLEPTPGRISLDTISVILEGDTARAWAADGEEVWELTSPLELVFFDGFETADTAVWGTAAP